MADWVTGVAAVASVIFGVISWWRSSESQKAREDAEAARRTAERQAVAAERSAAAVAQQAEATRQTALELEQLTESLRGPALTLDLPHDAGHGASTRLLTNHRAEQLRILELVNASDTGPIAGLELPQAVPAHGQVPIKLPRGRACPAHLELEVEGIGLQHVRVR